MSLLKLSCPDVGDMSLKCTAFSSPLTGVMASSQTKHAMHHFPIKADQQNIQFDCVFRNWSEYRDFQDYIRKHQMRALTTVQNPEITLNWPERDIVNWSGVVSTIKAGDDRFNIAPKAQVNFLLVDSMLSQKTWTSSFGENFTKWFQTDIGDPVVPLIVPPSPGSLPGVGVIPGVFSGLTGLGH